MRSKRAAVAMTVATGLTLGAVGFGLAVPAKPQPREVQFDMVPDEPVPTPTIRITEDDPRWDCRTMGNRVCGPGAPKPVRVPEPDEIGWWFCVEYAPSTADTAACDRQYEGPWDWNQVVTAGWVRADAGMLEDLGMSRECVWLEGDTSLIACADGTVETS